MGQTTLEFFIEIIWSMGMGIFISGLVILYQSGWSDIILFLAGFIVMAIGSYLKGRFN